MTGRSRIGPWLMAGLIIGVTVLTYFPSIHGAVLWDDNGHVTKPELQSLVGLLRIWFELGASQQYYPMLHTAFWAEHRIWGDATTGYHLVNILLHAISACLLAVALRRLCRPAGGGLGWPWLAALLFALHPVCVESVAWISEQKNTLSGVFYLLAAIAFLSYRDRVEAPGRRWRALGLYLLASFLFVLALLSKTVTATLPAALLVALWWRDGRLSLRRDIAPLLPWFGLGGLMGMATAWIERNVVGAEGGSFELSLLQRGLLAGRVIWFYLGKLFWPDDLIFVYPHWTIDTQAWWQYLFPLGILILLAALWLPIRIFGNRRATRAPLAAFLFFSGTLFPVLGFFNIYPFRFSYVADHFQYLASIGIISLGAASWGGWVGRDRQARISEGRARPPGAPFPAVAPYLLAAAVVVLFAVLSWRQSRMYQSDETLYRTTLARNPDCWMAENNLGTYLTHIPGRSAEAIALFHAALRLKPDYVEGHNNLGSEYSKIPGRVQDAIDELNEAVRLNPNFADARNNLGLALAQAGRLGDAEAQFREALRLKPDFPEAHNDLGITLGETGRLDQALAEFNESLRLRPEYSAARKNLAFGLARAGRLADALAEYEQVARETPDDRQVRQIIAVIRQHMPSLDRQ